MVQRVSTVAFEGIEARAVDVQVQIAPGMPAFNVVAGPTRRFRRRVSACARP
jgi:magnesium chelatase family protein